MASTIIISGENQTRETGPKWQSLLSISNNKSSAINIHPFSAYSSLFQPSLAYSSIFQPIPAHSSLFQPSPAYSSLLKPIPAYSSVFQPIPVYSSLFQAISAYSSLFQPISRDEHEYSNIKVVLAQINICIEIITFFILKYSNIRLMIKIYS